MMEAGRPALEAVPRTHCCSRTQPSPRTCKQFVAHTRHHTHSHGSRKFPSSIKEHTQKGTSPRRRRRPLIRRQPPVDAVVPGVDADKRPQRGLHAGRPGPGPGPISISSHAWDSPSHGAGDDRLTRGLEDCARCRLHIALAASSSSHENETKVSVSRQHACARVPWPCLCVRNQDRDRIAGRCHGCVGFEEKAAREELELARHARVQSDLFMCSLGVTYIIAIHITAHCYYVTYSNIIYFYSQATKPCMLGNCKQKLACIAWSFLNWRSLQGTVTSLCTSS